MSYNQFSNRVKIFLRKFEKMKPTPVK